MARGNRRMNRSCRALQEFRLQPEGNWSPWSVLIRGARADLHLGRVTVLLCAEQITGLGVYQGSHGNIGKLIGFC